ncbi:MAG: zinc-dependent dehydrogenase [Deltaproteobacteria bacterium]|nr:zinc-dependent dehydrogenase [Deltaproteobacteria bacterium]
MRVAKYYNNADVRVEEMPVPEIGPRELLVKVMASGICGSDVMEWYRIKKAPLVLGHEIAGEIAETGEKVTAYSPGDRVFVSHHVPCGACRYCLAGQETVCDTLRSTNFDPGGFAEFLRVPEINVGPGVFKIPDNVSFEDGTFIEPLACALRGQRAAGVRPGETVLVLGAGISGMLHVELAKNLGAGLVLATDLHPFRLEMARAHGAMGFDAREDVPARVREANHGRGADLVIICTSAAPAFAQAMDSVNRGGRVLWFAPSMPGETFPLDVFSMWKEGFSLIPSYGAAPRDIQASIELLEAGRLDVHSMITHRLPLSETAKGFSLVASAGESMKVIIFPQE